MDLPQSKEATIINITMASTAKAKPSFPAEDDGAIEGANATIASATAAVDALNNNNNNNNNNNEENEHSSNDDVSVASDITDVAIAVADEQENHFDEDINAAPMHLHALTGVTKPRLRGKPGMTRHNSDGKLVNSAGGGGGGGGGSIGGSTRSMGGSIGRSTRSMGEPGGQQQVKGGRRSRSTSRSVGGGRRSANSSRSSSPLPANKHHEGVGGEVGSHGVGGRGAGDASTAYSAAQSVHSGYSSLDGMFDPDLLLDRLGFIDLDPPLPHEIRCGPLAAPGTIDGKSNNSGGLTPVNERLSEETLDDCHAFNDLVMIDNLKHLSAHGGGMSSTLSMPSVAHSSLSGIRSDMSVGSLSVGSFKGGAHSRGGSVAGGSLMGDGENSVFLGTLDEEGEDEVGED